MDMQARHQDQRVFHLSGQRAGDGLLPVGGRRLRPALLAPYRDLNALRHDFPLVLETRRGAPEFVHTLSGLVDGVLKDVAPRGIEGERLRRHALQLESRIRRALAEGASGSLAELLGPGALASDADLVLLDEPTALLDPDSQNGVLQLLWQLTHRPAAPLTALWITHRLEELQHCDGAALMEHGSVGSWQNGQQLAQRLAPLQGGRAEG